MTPRYISPRWINEDDRVYQDTGQRTPDGIPIYEHVHTIRPLAEDVVALVKWLRSDSLNWGALD